MYIRDLIPLQPQCLLEGLINQNPPSLVQQHHCEASKYRNIQANHSEAYRHGFYCRSVRLWNQLPVVIRDSSSIESFREWRHQLDCPPLPGIAHQQQVSGGPLENIKILYSVYVLMFFLYILI